MLFVWEAMGGIYGTLFVNAFGDSPTTGAGLRWASGLAGFSRAQIVRGLNACQTRPDNFPPSLGQFRALCLGSADAPQPAPTPAQALDRDEERKRYDIAHFRRMRELGQGLGLDVFEHEAEHGIRYHDGPPPPVNPERVAEFQRNIARMLR